VDLFSYILGTIIGAVGLLLGQFASAVLKGSRH